MLDFDFLCGAQSSNSKRSVSVPEWFGICQTQCLCRCAIVICSREAKRQFAQNILDTKLACQCAGLLVLDLNVCVQVWSVQDNRHFSQHTTRSCCQCSLASSRRTYLSAHSAADAGRPTPSVACVVQPGSAGGFQKVFFGREEVAIPVEGTVVDAARAYPRADIFINFASMVQLIFLNVILLSANVCHVQSLLRLPLIFSGFVWRAQLEYHGYALERVPVQPVGAAAADHPLTYI